LPPLRRGAGVARAVALPLMGHSFSDVLPRPAGFTLCNTLAAAEQDGQVGVERFDYNFYHSACGFGLRRDKEDI